MEFHKCKNCCLIDTVMENKIQRYDTLSVENIGLHNALIKSKDTIMHMEWEIINLCNGLFDEKQNNLRIQIKKFSKHLQSSNEVGISAEQCKQFKQPVSAAQKNKTDSISIVKYNELQNLIDKQNRMYEDDLDLFRSLSDKCNEKLKQKLEAMRPHLTIISEMCEDLENDLMNEQKEAVECRQLVDNAIKTIKFQHTKQLINVENEIMLSAKNVANANVRETQNIMKNQLADRNKLITKLCEQKLIMETYVDKQEQELRKKQQDHKEAILKLEKRIIYSNKKYKELGRRHSLERQGFRTDIANICKEIKQMKDKLGLTGQKCENYKEIQKLEEYVKKIDNKISSVYF